MRTGHAGDNLLVLPVPDVDATAALGGDGDKALPIRGEDRTVGSAGRGLEKLDLLERLEIPDLRHQRIRHGNIAAIAAQAERSSHSEVDRLGLIRGKHALD